MTPLQLEVLMHYYVKPSYHPQGSDDGLYSEAHDIFLIEGILVETEWNDEVSFKLTEKGDWFVKHILALPFPSVTFTIEKENRDD